MITYKTTLELEQSQLLVGDLIQVLGDTREGDRAPRTGIVHTEGFTSSNQTITISGGLVVELMPETVHSPDIHWVYARDHGVLPANTADQNTAAWQALVAQKKYILLDRGVYRFDVFRTGDVGIEVQSTGDKTNTVIELEGRGSVVSGQLNKAKITGIHFKSVLGSVEWQRMNVLTDVHLFRCKVSGFLHEVAAPNSWGIYSKDSTGCILEECEFENNSQSDIAILEGTEDLVIRRCYHTGGSLRVNFEPNNNIKPIKRVKVEQCRINLLELLNNDLAQNNDHVVVVENCTVETLRYDGLGADFINTRINSYVNADNLGGRQYMSRLSGISAGPELLDDPNLNVVALSNTIPLPWKLRYSTTPPDNRYNRDPDGGVRISVNVASSTNIQSNVFPVTEEALLITRSMRVERSGGRPDIMYIEFFNSSSSSLGIMKMVRGILDTKYATTSAIVVPPAGSASAAVVILGGDTETASSFQTLVWKYVSVREIPKGGIGSLPMADTLPKLSKRVSVPFTHEQFLTGNPYLCPLPAGTIVELAYQATKPRLVEITKQADNVSGKLGETRTISSYP